MRVQITLDIDIYSDAKADLTRLVECWLADQADTTIEAVDPNTDQVLGEFSYEARSIEIRVENKWGQL